MTFNPHEPPTRTSLIGWWMANGHPFYIIETTPGGVFIYGKLVGYYGATSDAFRYQLVEWDTFSMWTLVPAVRPEGLNV